MIVMFYLSSYLVLNKYPDTLGWPEWSRKRVEPAVHLVRTGGEEHKTTVTRQLACFGKRTVLHILPT